MRVLIIGGTGLLGNRLVAHFLKEKWETYVTYTPDFPPRDLAYGASLQQLDVTDAETVANLVSEVKPDVVVNAAAISDVDLCELKKETAWKVNAEGAKAVAIASSKNGSFLIQVSTSYVFDGRKGSYSENEKPNPLNTYGYTKLKGEEFVRNSAVRSCIARTDVIFGWGRESRPNFATYVINSIEKGETVRTVIDQYNSPTLNTNLAAMIGEVAQRRIEGVLHLAGATRISRMNFAMEICKVFGLSDKLIQPEGTEANKLKANRPVDSSLRVEKAKKTLHSKPLSIREALKILKDERKSF